MPLSHATFQKLIDLFTPHFETLSQRRTLIGSSFFGTDVLAKVQLEGTAYEFTTRTIQMLVQHGEIEPGTPAIIRLMQQLRGTVGVDKQAEIDALIDTIRYDLAANPARPTGKPRIFISYSRADGEDFATDLRKRLESEGLPLWQDRARMEGGVGWWQQITDALDAVEFMVLVATPAAIASPVVKKEWRYARQQGVCVYPVQVPGLPLDFAAMPKWMRDGHFHNLEHEWQTFVNYLKSPCTIPKVPFMAPDLPEHFVQRPEKFDALKVQLLDANFDNPVAITTALKGAGGFGKTTLATALCHDEDVQTAFDEGVLWVTLGETPNIINKLNVLYRALTDENPSFIEIEEGANKLAEKLVDADVLMVIDDVWNPAHLRPFLRGGERTARLVTTRFSNIAVDANAERLEVDEMTADESVQMLLAGIAPPDDLTPFRDLAERLGEWALMLEVTNGTLRKRMAKGADLDGALAYVNKALDRRGIGGLKTGSNEAAVQVLDTSIEQVEPEDQPRLFELAIFAEDTDVPLTSVMALWDLDDFDTEELIDQFDDLSFVRFDAERGVIRLHDVVREVLASRLDDPAAIHARLIDNYGDLTALPDDYAWNQIAYHLIESGRADTLRTLLLDYDFLRAKLDATDINALIADCDPLQGDEPIRLVRSALEMSLHVLSERKDQLPYQLTGRLWTRRKEPELASLWQTTHAVTPLDLLETQSYLPMLQAGGPLLRTMEHKRGVNGAFVLSDGRLLSWSNDKTLRLWSADGDPLTVLEGHTDKVTGALELTNGRLLSWSNDKTLRLWSTNGAPLTVLEGHTDTVTGALKLSDGRLLSWSNDKTLRLWSADGDPLTVLEGHTDKVTGALELADGRLLSGAYGYESEDHTLRLWSVDGELLTVLEGHTKSVPGALELADGRLLSWSNDKTLRLWTANGAPLAVLEGHTDTVTGALKLSDGRLLSWANNPFSGHHDHTLRLWSANGDLLAVLEGHTDAVIGAEELSDGRLLSWAGSYVSKDHTLRLWSANGAPLAVLEGHTNTVRGAKELSDGRLLSWANNSFSGHYDHTLRLWSADGVPLTVLEGHMEMVRGAKELSDGRLLSWSSDSTLRLWSADGDPLVVLKGHTDEVTGVRILSDGRLLSWAKAYDIFSEGQDHTLRFWSIDGVASLDSQVLPAHEGSVKGLLVLTNGRLLSWSSDSTLRLWSADGVPLTVLEGHMGRVGALQLSDGRLLSWSSDSTLRLWSTDGTPLTVLEGHTDAVTGVRILSDGRLLSWASGYGSEDYTLRLWSADGAPLTVLEGHMGRVGALQLSDGRLLSWARDNTSRLWSAAGTPLAVLEGHTSSVSGALELSDGRLLSWSNDNTLRLWSPDGAPRPVLEGHTESVWGAKELSDGRLLSWSNDKTLRLWSVDGALLAVLEGHTESVWGAKELSDGRLLSWARGYASEDYTLRLWFADGAPLGVLESWFDQRDDDFLAWLTIHGVDVRELPNPFVFADENNAGSALVIPRSANRMLVQFAGDFIGDARFRAVAVRGQTIVVGDDAGRVIFLRVRAGDEFLNKG